MERIQVLEEDAGGRLDKFVAAKEPALSRSATRDLIDQGLVRVEGQARKANYRIKSGQTVTIELPPQVPGKAQAQEIPLKIVYEDAAMLVVDKPPGMVVHPAAGHEEGTLVNAVLGHSPNLVTGHAERPGIVHRLDRDTSGLIVIAKTDPALRSLQQQFATRRVHKTYLALVHGEVSPSQGRIEAPLRRDPHDRKRFSVSNSPGARRSTTIFRVVERMPGFTLLQVQPQTGRTHQIRIHLEFIHHPVVADPVYGRAKKSFAGLKRQFLHAWKLGLAHPITGESMEFTAPLPEDLQSALVRVGGNPGPFV